MSVRPADYYRAAIAASGMDIYSPIDPDDADYYIPAPILQELLNRRLVGLNFAGVPLRTRSKMVKEAACHALGYPVPKRFTKLQPRFTGQNFDTYNQQSLNLQIWNEPIDPTRRYALVRIGADGVVRQVVVVHGGVLIPLDTTGRLTTKYQAQLVPGADHLNLLTPRDTEPLLPYLAADQVVAALKFDARVSPIDQPLPQNLLPIAEIFRRLTPLVGRNFPDAGPLQDRLRGAELHRLICYALGYESFQDSGQFPDVRHQLLEVKLQMSPTIDLGLVLPTSLGAVRGIHGLGTVHPRHCDTRYAIFAAGSDGGVVTLTHLYVVSGMDFFDHFRQFQGRVQNRKIQIPLPPALFR